MSTKNVKNEKLDNGSNKKTDTQGNKIDTHSKIDTTKINKKSGKSLVTYAISVGLGLLAAIAFICVLIVEVKGRNMKVSPEQWKELMKEHPYERKETDVRSPCPMLNTLANHGFIARNGRNIKSNDLFDALMLMGASPMVAVGLLGFVYSQLNEANPENLFISQFGFLPSLDLDRLTVFNILEHDVSLTRNDTRQAPYDTQHVVPEYVHRMVKLAEFSNKNTKDEGLFTRKNEHDARRLRWLESTKYNRYMHLNLFSQFASSIECSLLLYIIGRDGQISLPHLKSFLLNESFPEDWHPRTTTSGFLELATKPLMCWTGLHKSNVELNLLQEIQ